MGKNLRIVCMSDTHNRHKDPNFVIPDGDILIHAGDLTARGDLKSIRSFSRFLDTLPHRHKIVIAGNHDFAFQRTPEEACASLTNCIYLQDQEIEIEGLRIYGSPWQPWFFDWAFNLERGPDIRQKWDLIPKGIDILVTHGPPLGHGDMTSRGDQVGCQDLLAVIEDIKPKYHIFGHIHENHGITKNKHTTFVNASICDLSYQPVQKTIVLDL